MKITFQSKIIHLETTHGKAQMNNWYMIFYYYLHMLPCFKVILKETLVQEFVNEDWVFGFREKKLQHILTIIFLLLSIDYFHIYVFDSWQQSCQHITFKKHTLNALTVCDYPMCYPSISLCLKFIIS